MTGGRRVDGGELRAWRATWRLLMLGALSAASVSLVTAPARAQSSEDSTRGAARKLGYEGVEAFQAGRYAEATQKLEKAYAVLRVPSLGLWSARALAKVGKLVEATERYLEVTRLPVGAGDVEIQRRAQADAQVEADSNQQLTPTLRIRVEGVEPSAVKVTIDGAAVASALLGEATPANPGRRVVVGTVGAQIVRGEATLEPGKEAQITLRFEAVSTSPAAAPAASPVAIAGSSSPSGDVGPRSSSTQRTVGWVVLAGGGAGIIAGGIVGIAAITKRNALDLVPGCEDKVCPNHYADDVDALNTMRTVSTVSLIAGGALAATGAVLLLTAPRSRTAASLWLTPASAGVRGTF